jgi:transposase
MKTASSEIRTIVVKAYDAGISRQQLAAIVGYHLNSVSRWIREFERENRLEAHPRGHRGSIFSEDERRELVEVIGKQPDITLEELRSRFAKACNSQAAKITWVDFQKNSAGKRTKARGYNPGQS